MERRNKPPPNRRRLKAKDLKGPKFEREHREIWRRLKHPDVGQEIFKQCERLARMRAKLDFKGFRGLRREVFWSGILHAPASEKIWWFYHSQVFHWQYRHPMGKDRRGRRLKPKWIEGQRWCRQLPKLPELAEMLFTTPLQLKRGLDTLVGQDRMVKWTVGSGRGARIWIAVDPHVYGYGPDKKPPGEFEPSNDWVLTGMHLDDLEGVDIMPTAEFMAMVRELIGGDDQDDDDRDD